AEDKRIAFRVGVNLGDVIIDGDDIYCDGVNIAARLEALAEPGGVCISHAVDQILDKLPYAFSDMGEKKVNNIARPLRVYALAAAALAAFPPVTRRRGRGGYAALRDRLASPLVFADHCALGRSDSRLSSGPIISIRLSRIDWL